MNVLTISGHLTRDPEIRTTANGKTIANFSLAWNDREKNPQGEWQDRANFADGVAFGYQAERMARDTAKGTEVAIIGRLRYNAWETKDGAKRSRLEIIAEEVKKIAKPEPKAETAAEYEEIPW